jgi:hypothetical protein
MEHLFDMILLALFTQKHMNLMLTRMSIAPGKS